ncbi:MAG TPA: CPBP family intramembrane glutamic endopeptidase [Candidatus Polarisedimenticolaceae bacterium]|nr:CPBP family intramembrane glutamic endopeptidase [Candidatus Polarisedimenticolaceae bacterium]
MRTATPTLLPPIAFGRRDLQHGLLLAVTMAGVVSMLSLAATPGDRTARATAFILLSLPPLLLALPAWSAAARRWAAEPLWRWWYTLGLVVAVAPSPLVRQTPGDVVRFALYVFVVMLLDGITPREGKPLWRHLFVVAAVWLPMEFNWVHGDFVLKRLLGIDLLLLLYSVERPHFSLGRVLPSTRREWAWGLGTAAAFLAFAIPFAMATGFASPGLARESAGRAVLQVVVVFWIIALPEEALFRGVIQGLLSRSLRFGWALGLAAVIFGVAHLDNGPHPDMRYLVLATVAGAAYGLAYRRTGTLAASTLTHFLVDFIWHGCFAGPRS